MTKLSKNHIMRAKKAVQDGREPDEEFLVKARRAYKELMELDEEKVTLAAVWPYGRSREGKDL